MMDRLTIEAAEAAVDAGYPDGASAVLIVELDGVPRRSRRISPRVEAICRECGRVEIRAAADDAERALLWKGRKSAFAAMGRDLARLLRAGRRRAAHEAARGAAPRSRGSRPSTACASATSSTPATATSTRSSSTTSAVEGEAGARAASSPTRSSSRASTPAARSPASTASGRTRRARCRCSSPRTTSRRCSGCGAPSTRPGSQPGQALPDAAPLRRGAGPVPSAPAREAGPCRASLSVAHEAGRRPRASAAASRSTRAVSRLSTRARPGARARGRRPHVHRRGGHAAVRAARAARRARPDARARSAGRSDARRVPRRRPLRPARHRYGRLRDLVLGVTVVLGDGIVASSGGKVVKNVAGYDLGKLFCGSGARSASICA